jgi:hypothetical protein
MLSRGRSTQSTQAKECYDRTHSCPIRCPTSMRWTRMSPSERQLSDVRSLRDGVAALDSDYLERSASALGLSELRDQARQ